MSKKVVTPKTTTTQNTVQTNPEQVYTPVLEVVEQVEVTDPTFTQFVGNGITINVTTPCTVLQLQGVHSVFTDVQGVSVIPKVHNKIPQNLQLHKSTVQNPVKYFWGTIGDVINSGVNTRKGIIEHYVNLGVSYYTVRTQYQVWFGMNKKNTTTEQV